MVKIEIKPLSVNKAWKGRRYKTNDYKKYERDVLLILPKKCIIPEGNLQVFYKFGFSNILSDYDNPIKIIQDILQKKYKFDDRRIYKAVVEKEIVKKGCEYIEFNISKLCD